MEIVLAIAGLCIIVGAICIELFTNYVSLSNVLSKCSSDESSDEIGKKFGLTQNQVKGKESLRQASFLFWLSLVSCCAAALKAQYKWYAVLIILCTIVSIAVCVRIIGRNRVKNNHARIYDFICACIRECQKGNMPVYDAIEKIDRNVAEAMAEAAKLYGASAVFFLLSLVLLGVTFA